MHLGVVAANVIDLYNLKKKIRCYIIEDACHALQAEFNSKKCGSFGELGCFSFHPLKNLNVL